MEVFISWSGERSKAVAIHLKTSLEQLFPIKFWMSETDIGAGTDWSAEIHAALQRATIGIICLTTYSAESKWVMFEAGALSHSANTKLVCPLLIDLTSDALTESPLANRQKKATNKQEMKQLLESINNVLGDRKLLPAPFEREFERWWLEFAEKLDNLPSERLKSKEILSSKPHQSATSTDAQQKILEFLFDMIQSEDTDKTLKAIAALISEHPHSFEFDVSMVLTVLQNRTQQWLHWILNNKHDYPMHLVHAGLLTIAIIAVAIGKGEEGETFFDECRKQITNHPESKLTKNITERLNQFTETVLRKKDLKLAIEYLYS